MLVGDGLTLQGGDEAEESSGVWRRLVAGLEVVRLGEGEGEGGEGNTMGG